MTDPLPDDALARAMAGDRAALALLMERHGPRIRERIGAEIPARWRAVLTAEDVMQEAYTRAFLGISGLRAADDEGFARWLGVLARHVLIDTLRALQADKRGGGRRAEALSGDESVLALHDALGADSATPSRAARRNEAISLTRASLQSLPELQRRVVEAYDLDGRTIEEVAALIGRTSGAAYMLRSRALARLREVLGDPSHHLTR